MAVPQPFPTAGCCDGLSEPLCLPACPLALVVTWDPSRLGSEHSGARWRAPSSPPRCRCLGVLQFAVLERSMMDPDLRSGQATRRYLQLPEEGVSVSVEDDTWHFVMRWCFSSRPHGPLWPPPACVTRKTARLAASSPPAPPVSLPGHQTTGPSESGFHRNVRAYGSGLEGTSGSSWYICRATSFPSLSCTFAHFFIRTAVNPVDSRDTNTDTKVWGAS